MTDDGTARVGRGGEGPSKRDPPGRRGGTDTPRRPRDWTPDRRPTGTSATLSAVAGIVAVVGIGVDGGFPGPATLVAASGAGFAVALRLLLDTDPIRTAAGSFLGFAAACGIVGAVAWGPTAGTAALALGAVGAVSTPTGVIGDDRFTETLGVLVYTLVPLGCLSVVAVALRAAAPGATSLFRVLRSTTGAGAVLVSSLLAVGAAVAVRVALRRVPAARLAPGEERDRVRGRISRVERRLSTALRVGVVAVALGGVLWGAERIGPEWVSSLARVSGALAGTPLVQYSLLGVLAIAVVVTSVVAVTKWLGQTVVQTTRRRIATTVGVGVAVVLVAVHGPALDAVVGTLDVRSAIVMAEFVAFAGPVATVTILVLLGVTVFTMASLVVPGAVGLGLAPDRATAPAFGAGGLLAGVALVVGTLSPPVVFAGTVAAMVVWDLGEYGVAMAEEVGRGTDGRAESVHAAATLVVGTLVVVAATAAHAVVTRVPVQEQSALAALVVAFVGAVFLSALLRG